MYTCQPSGTSRTNDQITLDNGSHDFPGQLAGMDMP